MPKVVKTTESLNISIICRDMSETILRINNPAGKSYVTMSAIKEAFSSVIPGTASGEEPQFLFNKNGEPYRYVSKAALVTTVTTTEDVS